MKAKAIEILLVLIGLAGCILWLHHQKPPTTHHSPFTIHTTAPASHYTDTAGRTHAVIIAAANTYTAAQISAPHSQANAVDSLARLLKIKNSQLQEFTRENISLKAQVQLKPSGKPADSVYCYADKWLQLCYALKTGKATLSYNVNITAGKYTPASWLPWTRKPAVIDFYADDPRATINGVQHVTITPPQPFVGFSASAQAYYLIDTRQITPAIGASLRLGRFHFEDNFYYSGKLRQAPGISYDLIKINP